MGMIGIVADDLTGANDIGCMFARSGYRTNVYAFGAWNLPVRLRTDAPDVAIIDTNSRYDPVTLAVRKVTEATATLAGAGCDRFFKKTCSVFRGSVGAEMDAFLDALHRDFAVVVAGYPKNRRATRDGVMYVDGVPLDESHFRSDPVHPTLNPNLVDVLRAQTYRPVHHAPQSLLEEGPDGLRARLKETGREGGYLFVDAPDQEALATIAEASADEAVFAGSAGLAEDLARVWGLHRSGSDEPPHPDHGRKGILCVAGSTSPVTAEQVAHLAAKGAMVIPVEAATFLKHAGAATRAESLVGRIADRLQRGGDVVLQSDGRPEALQAARELGRSRGLTDVEVAVRISSGLASVAALALQYSGARRLVVAGGDTAAAVCADLGIDAMRVWREIEPGLPAVLSLAAEPGMLVLKGGSMGSSAFLERAFEFLRAH